MEKKFNRWAENQELIWEDWADRYSQKWESWADELDEEDLSPEEVSKLIRRNLKMLGDMPLGELVEGLMKEGSEGFESAPWESLSDLQSIFQESIERTVRETERRVAEAQEKAQVASEAADEGLEFILPVIEKQQEGLRAKEKALASEADSVLNQIRDKLSAGKATKSDLAKLMKLIDKQNATSNSKEAIRKRLKEVELVAKKQAIEKRERVEQARRVAEKRLAESLQRVKERESRESKVAEQDRLREIYESLQSEEAKIRYKNRELEMLRKEVQQLRKEVQKMTKDRSGK